MTELDLAYSASSRVTGVLTATPEQLQRILELNPTSLSAEEVAVVPARMSTGRLDAYYTRMAASTLRNYADDARIGVSVQDSHNHRQLGIGYTFSGEFAPGFTAEESVADALFYTIRGLRFGTGYSFPSTDDYLRALDAGIVRDVSVGFRGGDFVCDICGRDLFGGSCDHIPGFRYKSGNAGERVLATATIEDAHLSELSIVFDGATPGASILKARHMADVEELEPWRAEALENHYQRQHPGLQFNIKRRWSLGQMPSPQGGFMDGASEVEAVAVPATEAPVEERSVSDEGSRTVQELAEARAEVVTLRTRLTELQTENDRLRPLADVGVQYRRDMIESALQEGVRAHGTEFNLETYRGILESLPLDAIKRMTADWKKVGDNRIPSGRQTQEPAPRVAQPETPDDSTTYRA